jgi:hypothetical protein
VDYPRLLEIYYGSGSKRLQIASKGYGKLFILNMGYGPIHAKVHARNMELKEGRVGRA